MKYTPRLVRVRVAVRVRVRVRIRVRVRVRVRVSRATAGGSCPSRSGRHRRLRGPPHSHLARVTVGVELYSSGSGLGPRIIPT